METGSFLRRAAYLSRTLRWAATLVLLATGGRHDAHAQTTAPTPISIELNKLEPLPAPTATPGNAAEVVAGCRVYVVVTNPDAEPTHNCGSTSSYLVQTAS